MNEFKLFEISNLHDITGGECNTCDPVTQKDDITTGDIMNQDKSECVDGKDAPVTLVPYTPPTPGGGGF